jgi:hypothetical protein
MLFIGPEAEQRFGHRHFSALTAVFTAAPEFTVLHGRDEIGRTDPVLLTEHIEGQRLLLLAARSWRSGACRAGSCVGTTDTDVKVDQRPFAVEGCGRRGRGAGERLVGHGVDVVAEDKNARVIPLARWTCSRLELWAPVGPLRAQAGGQPPTYPPLASRLSHGWRMRRNPGPRRSLIIGNQGNWTAGCLRPAALRFLRSRRLVSN